MNPAMELRDEEWAAKPDSTDLAKLPGDRGPASIPLGFVVLPFGVIVKDAMKLVL